MDPMEARVAFYNAISEAKGKPLTKDDEAIVAAIEDLIRAHIDAALDRRTAEDE